MIPWLTVTFIKSYLKLNIYPGDGFKEVLIRKMGKSGLYELANQSYVNPSYGNGTYHRRPKGQILFLHDANSAIEHFRA